MYYTRIIYLFIIYTEMTIFVIRHLYFMIHSINFILLEYNIIIQIIFNKKNAFIIFEH